MAVTQFPVTPSPADRFADGVESLVAGSVTRGRSDAAPPSPPGDDPSLPTPLQLTRPQVVYVWLAGVMIAALLLANIIGVKLFHIDLTLFGRTIPVEHTVGMLVFPVTFLLTDLINEYYGRRATRRIAYVAFTMALGCWGMLYLARMLPTLEGIPGTATSESFENVFGAASLMYLASVIAFLLGSLLDIFLFGVFKRLTGGRLVWLRATGSTVVSQLFDSFAVTFLFFLILPWIVGTEAAPIAFIIKTALTGYVLKFVISILMTPVIYGGRAVMSRGLGMKPLPVGAGQ